MKIVHIDRLAPGGATVELHPRLTLLRGCGPELRHRLRTTFRALAGDGSPSETGVMEVNGVRLSVEPSTVAQLGLSPGIDPVLSLNSGPGTAQVNLPPPVVVVSNDEAALRAQLREVTASRTELGTRIDMVREGLDPYANAALEVCIGQIDALESRRSSLRVEWNRVPGEADARLLAAAAQLSELRSMVDCAEILSMSAPSLRSALDDSRQARHPIDEPDQAALELADSLTLAAMHLGDLEGSDQRARERVKEANAQLMATREWIVEMNSRAGRARTDRTVVQRLEAVRDELFAADERSGKPSGRAKRRVVELRSEEAVLLDHLGFDTYSAYVMGIPSVRAELDRADELERAEADEQLQVEALAAAEAALPDPAVLDRVRGQFRDLLDRAFERLGVQGATAEVGSSDVSGVTDALRQCVVAVGSTVLGAGGSLDAALEATIAAMADLRADAPQGPVTVDSPPPRPQARLGVGELAAEQDAEDLLEWIVELSGWVRKSEISVVELERFLGQVDSAAEMEQISRWAQVESELDEALDRMAAAQERVRSHEEATARLADLRTEELDLRDRERELLERIAAADAAIVPPAPPLWSEPAPEASGSTDPIDGDDPESVEWALISRLARQRNVSFVGSVPLLVEGVPLNADARTSLLTRALRMSELVQIVLVTDDTDSADWIDALGDRALRVDL